MADVSHIEKMGRELKCPICLSLFKSAATINCNHVFCNSCILKSMKKESNCPVCKLPFHRREIRLAPHMDNLVGIYKSMEASSGVKMFMSESVPSSPLQEKITKDCINVENDDQRYSDNLVRSSFPSQKRIRVAQYPLPETPINSTKTGNKSSKQIPEEQHHVKSNTDLCNRLETSFSPFFWLKDDEDVEDLSLSSEGTFQEDGTPPEDLSFSDMKDSDTDSPYKGNTQGESHEKFPAVDLSECTQRPCSPEPCPMSTVFEIKPGQPEGASHDRDLHESHQLVYADHLGQETADKKQETQNPSKRKKKGRKSQITSNDSVLKPHCDIPEENAKKRCKKSGNFETAQESVCTGNSWNPIDKEVDAEFPKMLKKSNNCKSKIPKIVKFRDLSNNADNKRKVEAITANLRVKKITSMNEPSEDDEKKSHTEVPKISITKSCLRSKRQGLNLTRIASHENGRSVHVDAKPLLEGSSLNSQDQDTSVRVLPPKGLSEIEDSPADTTRNITVVDPLLVSREKSGKYHSLTKSSSGIRNLSRLKNSAVEPSSSAVTAKKVPGNSEEVTDDSSMQDKSHSFDQRSDLHECEPNVSKIQCAFCQSTEDSKPYGKVIQYLDGQPVSSNHNEGAKLIHCHQICAEWAPNVYFKDETAMNLKAEITRSRRISCSCCGVKGAALGCFHKSCHRSFHVPCAKLMPECKWDSENYVMLCPLHASSKLPCETSGSQKIRKIAGENISVQDRVISTNIPKSVWNGDSRRSADKLVLCCSALSDADKNVVTQFKMLSGVKDSNKWSSRVTHVIASVDENEACRRTLKVLMAILEGKWILSIKWIKACLDAKRFVDEQQYEIASDIHGIKNGPRLGRLRVHNKEPKLFHGLEFYLSGDFVTSYKGYLQDLITAGGGIILNRKPIVSDQFRPSTFIIYNLELPEKLDFRNKDSLLQERISQAKALANFTGAKAASNAWILNSIAACELQNIEE